MESAKPASQVQKPDISDESVDVEEAEKDEEENADLDQIRDNYLDYYLGNAEEDYDDDFYDRTKKGGHESIVLTPK